MNFSSHCLHFRNIGLFYSALKTTAFFDCRHLTLYRHWPIPTMNAILFCYTGYQSPTKWILSPRVPFEPMEMCEMKFHLINWNSLRVSINKSTLQYFASEMDVILKADCINILFISKFVVDTWNVFPVMSKNDKSAGLWKVRVCSCFVMCQIWWCTQIMMLEIKVNYSDMIRKLQGPRNACYWFLFVYCRHNCSHCCKWLMESYISLLILVDVQ